VAAHTAIGHRPVKHGLVERGRCMARIADIRIAFPKQLPVVRSMGVMACGASLFESGMRKLVPVLFLFVTFVAEFRRGGDQSHGLCIGWKLEGYRIVAFAVTGLATPIHRLMPVLKGFQFLMAAHTSARRRRIRTRRIQQDSGCQCGPRKEK